MRDVHLREQVSSTAFTDCVAIPHSIDTYAARSFIAVLHNDVAIPWGRHNVNFVLLIGIAKADMPFFRWRTMHSISSSNFLARLTRPCASCKLTPLTSLWTRSRKLRALLISKVCRLLLLGRRDCALPLDKTRFSRHASDGGRSASLLTCGFISFSAAAAQGRDAESGRI